MKVFLDARETRRMSVGMRAYVRELATRLERVAPDVQVATFGHGENFGLTEQLELPFRARDADLVHFPTIYAPMLLPRKHVVTIHDLIHLRYPELFPKSVAVYYTLFVMRLVHSAVHVIVGDQRTIADCERIGIDVERITVVPLGYEPSLLDVPATPAERPYFLYAGNHKPHKNLSTLIAAWISLPSEFDVDLYITGAEDFKVPPTRHSVRRLRFLGDVKAEALAGWMRGATALVQPSLAEGFGLPVLEALVRGVPVIAAENAAPTPLLPFVASFEARNAVELRSLLEEAVRQPQRLRGRAAEGEPIARAYTWDRFAAATASVYRDVLEVSPVR